MAKNYVKTEEEMSKNEYIKEYIENNMKVEKAIEFIAEDELVEVTPKNIRLRKVILNNKDREKAARR